MISTSLGKSYKLGWHHAGACSCACCCSTATCFCTSSGEVVSNCRHKTYRHFSCSSRGMPSKDWSALPSRKIAFKLVYSSRFSIRVKPLKFKYSLSLRWAVRYNLCCAQRSRSVSLVICIFGASRLTALFTGRNLRFTAISSLQLFKKYVTQFPAPRQPYFTQEWSTADIWHNSVLPFPTE